MKLHRPRFHLLLVAGGILALLGVGCSKSSSSENSIDRIRATTEKVDDERLVAADETPEDWLSHGRNYQESRYSPLDQIDTSNVGELGLAWSINLGVPRGIEATPIVVDGIMFLTGPWSVVYAIDVRKGEIIWIHDPQVPRAYGELACCDGVNRGVALYKGLVIVGTLDGRLVALDAATGKERWETLTVDPTKSYSITGAPRVFDGKVVIGSGGAEYGVRGYVTAYDAMTGEQLWRFYTVPGNPADGFESPAMEAAAKTWTGEWWKFGGGGTCWDSFAYDPELELLYVGVGNGSPWNREIRSPEGGDNLYLSSIVALDTDTGELAWHYQTTPGESWDYTATQHMILADLEIEGVTRKTLMQAPKNGFFYVIDRTNGEFISAEPFAHVNWATHVDPKTGRPVETSFARYTEQDIRIAPSVLGAHSWQPMAFSPATGWVYIPARDTSQFIGQPHDWKMNNDPRGRNLGVRFKPEGTVYEDGHSTRQFGRLLAWDPITQTPQWSFEYPTPASSGVLASGDLVFQGAADGVFRAFDATSGKLLWSVPLETGIIASPITYAVDGVQYITIAVGWGGTPGLHSTKLTEHNHPGTVYTFALGGEAPFPDFPEPEARTLINLPVTASDSELENGQQIFDTSCRTCHTGYDRLLPHPIYSTPETYQIFEQIVGQGAYLAKGMPNFGDRLSEQDVKDVKQYLLSLAQQMRASQ